MKKSSVVILSTVFLCSIVSCSPNEQWVEGSINGKKRDTTINGKSYRYNHYNGHYGWFPIYGGRISPNSYEPASVNQISSRSFSPVRTSGFTSGSSFSGIHSGGFGSSSHFSSAS